MPKNKIKKVPNPSGSVRRKTEIASHFKSAFRKRMPKLFIWIFLLIYQNNCFPDKISKV